MNSYPLYKNAKKKYKIAMPDQGKKSKTLLNAALVIALLLSFLTTWGCGGNRAGGDTGAATQITTPKTTASSTVPAFTGPQTTDAAPPVMDQATQTPPAASPQPAPAPPPAVFEITERQVNPQVVAPGGTLTFSAWVKGEAANVTIKTYEQVSGNLAMTVPLAFDTHAGSGIYRWTATAVAPAKKGVYLYYASGVSTGGASAQMPGVSGWTFCVGDPGLDCK